MSGSPAPANQLVPSGGDGAAPDVTPADLSRLAALVVDVPDFPEPGVGFKDITPLLASPQGFADAVRALVGCSPADINVVVGMEARGFIFGAAVALELGAGFVPVRKPGKLPRASLTETYTLEYESTSLSVHADALAPGARVLIVDDVLATGGTVAAAATLVRRLGGELAGVSVLMELEFLGGRRRLAEAGIPDVQAVLRLRGDDSAPVS